MRITYCSQNNYDLNAQNHAGFRLTFLSSSLRAAAPLGPASRSVFQACPNSCDFASCCCSVILAGSIFRITAAAFVRSFSAADSAAPMEGRQQVITMTNANKQCIISNPLIQSGLRDRLHSLRHLLFIDYIWARSRDLGASYAHMLAELWIYNFCIRLQR